MTASADAIAAASRWLGTFNDGDAIDDESGFSADHLREVIRLAQAANGGEQPGRDVSDVEDFDRPPPPHVA